MKTLFITRKNYLRSFLSLIKAQKTGQYTVTSSEVMQPDAPIRIDIDSLLYDMALCLAEDQLICRSFFEYSYRFEYDGRYVSYDYTDLFPRRDGGVSPHVLQEIAAWLEVSDTFPGSSEYQKQSYLPLNETIENFDDVTAVLRCTKFEYCLDDEPAYTHP